MVRTVLLVLACVAGASCAAATCPLPVPVDLSDAGAYARHDSLPFRFPLETHRLLASDDAIRTGFAAAGRTSRGNEYHAAEDYPLPAGAPVYAMADGRVSYSGRMGGYGWLVIIDHPQFDLYSLYGHLSPSRWAIEPGPVAKGDRIGSIGDADENGGTPERPMAPHLHLGVRAGRRADYPGSGQWRWMAGWVAPCPQDLGWLQPSAIIAAQHVPAGGFVAPQGGFFAKWGIEILLGIACSIAAVGVSIFAVRRDQTLVLFVAGAALYAIAWLLQDHTTRVGTLIRGLSVLLVAIGAVRPAPRATGMNRRAE